MYIGAIIIYRIFIHQSFCMEDTSKLLYMPWHKLNGITHYSQHFAVQRGRYTIGRLNLALVYRYQFIMMTSSNGNIFRVTGHLCGEFTGPRWIPRTKASEAELWCFLWSASEQTIEKTMTRLVIWDAIEPSVTSLWCMENDSLWNILAVGAVVTVGWRGHNRGKREP